MSKNAVLNLMGVKTFGREDEAPEFAAPALLQKWFSSHSEYSLMPLTASMYLTKPLAVAFKELFEGDLAHCQLDTEYLSTSNNAHHFRHQIELFMFNSKRYFDWKYDKLSGDEKLKAENDLVLVVDYAVSTDLDFNIQDSTIKSLKVHRLGSNENCDLIDLLNYMYYDNNLEQIIDRLHEVVDILKPIEFAESHSNGEFRPTPLAYLA